MNKIVPLLVSWSRFSCNSDEQYRSIVPALLPPSALTMRNHLRPSGPVKNATCPSGTAQARRLIHYQARLTQRLNLSRKTVPAAPVGRLIQKTLSYHAR